MHGQGKEYFSTGDLKYDGQYLYGVKDGKGKEYNIDCYLIYDGEYSKGKRWRKKRKRLF